MVEDGAGEEIMEEGVLLPGRPFEHGTIGSSTGGETKATIFRCCGTFDPLFPDRLWDAEKDDDLGLFASMD